MPSKLGPAAPPFSTLAGRPDPGLRAGTSYVNLRETIMLNR
jgi:hypothetical protein